MSQSGVGMIPSAPCKRSRRPSSRVEVWSSHLEYAASSAALPGWAVSSVRKSATPHGLMVLPRSPRSIAGHSWLTTERP